ncbi:MAG: response regulator transcription factor [Desulfosarcinaceae bacterium]|nr:response regulator transcription factor [Desulfosarcinaceae bacterium]
MRTRILLVDDHQIIREGLRSLLSKDTSVEIVGEAENGRLAVKKAVQETPDMIVMDMSMPDLNGIDASRQILAKQPRVKIIALSMHSEKQFVEGALRAGVSGYLLKDCAFEEMITAIHHVRNGNIYLSPGVTNVVVNNFLEHPHSADLPKAKALTNREREVVQLIAEGLTTRQISNQLHISVKTVETHRKHIMEKLDLQGVVEITKYAIREGLTSL